MEWLDIILLGGVGVVAGVVNTLAGGGSLLSVPLLVFVGLPADIANGTNRVGVLAQNLTAIAGFRRGGVPGLSQARPLLLPVVLGAAVGAFGVAKLSADEFEKVFGVVMLLLLVPMLRGGGGARAVAPSWSPPVRFAVFFGIGLYGGAVQAGVGLVLIAALSRSGIDLVLANSIKVVVIGLLTVVAVVVFVFEAKIAWWPALYLTLGFGLGGWLGAHVAVAGGDRVIRPVLVFAVVAMAGRMLGLY